MREIDRINKYLKPRVKSNEHINGFGIKQIETINTEGEVTELYVYFAGFEFKFEQMGRKQYANTMNSPENLDNIPLYVITVVKGMEHVKLEKNSSNALMVLHTIILNLSIDSINVKHELVHQEIALPY
ncbi:hypothetical protein [Spirosoma validum]|uniref:Uncharacterized protein n=1 Tax=Spirosoma validum TaxID=2771355 RepID=A0A927GDH7_9BACT|nr:hypothetical protein [Spirosoma validum]MBD2753729.1 hypothetical protein [Spirosoma validum]